MGPTHSAEQVPAVDRPWTVVAGCHHLLQAPHLRKLALGSHLIHVHAGDTLPPLADAAAVLQALNKHPALREVLLVARPGIMSAGVSAKLLEQTCSPCSLARSEHCCSCVCQLVFPRMVLSRCSLQPTVVVLEVLLRMASLRPTLTVRPIEHDSFFVVSCARSAGRAPSA